MLGQGGDGHLGIAVVEPVQGLGGVTGLQLDLHPRVILAKGPENTRQIEVAAVTEQ